MLTFDDAMAEQLSTVAATVGSSPARRLETTTKGAVITAVVPAGLRTEQAAATGEGTTLWRVAYRVVSADGHPVRVLFSMHMVQHMTNGTIEFRVKVVSPTATPGSQAASPDRSPNVSADDPTSSSRVPEQGSSAVPAVVLIAGLTTVLAAVAIGLLVRARRRDGVG